MPHCHRVLACSAPAELTTQPHHRRSPGLAQRTFTRFPSNTMSTANPAQSITAKVITIQNIKLRTQSRRNLPVARQFHIEFSVSEASLSTTTAKEAKNETSWDQVFYFDGDDRSQLLVKVYQKHRVGKDKEVGRITDTVSRVLGRLKDGVFEDTLRKDTSDKSDLSGITIKFAFAAEPHGQGSAEERQAADAVTGATGALDPLSSTPVAVGLVGSAVDTGTKVLNVVAKAQKVHTMETTWEVLLRRLERLDEVVTRLTEIHPYASLAWSVISAANKVLIKQKNRDDWIVRLSGTMSDAFSFVDDIKFMKEISKHAKTMTQLLQQVTECGYFIAQYAKDSFLTRTAKYAIAHIDQMIAAYENSFRDLRTALLEGVAVRTGMTVVRMMNVVERIAETTDLGKLHYAEGARFQWEKGCLLGTRVAFLKEICDILNNPDEDAPRVCLLTGIAGSGKSAVAHSIARLYDGQKRLGSSYCFSRTDVAHRNPTNLFTTIARDLSYRDPQYKAALCQVLKDDQALHTSQSPMEQLERLVIEPCRDLHAIGPLVIVIDALDESGDPTSRQHILRALSEKIAKNALPSHLRFLITARLETDILTELLACPQTVHRQMGEIPEDVVDGDIETFIHHSLDYSFVIPRNSFSGLPLLATSSEELIHRG
ncbi:hypothetical protein V8E55_008030 [Tylopilus felleus]